VRNGITEPPEYAITWPVPLLGDDPAWQLYRGGLTASAARLGSLVSPVANLTDDPGKVWGDVYRFRYQYSRSAYDLSVEHHTVPGWRGVVPDAVSLSNLRVR